MQFDRHAICMRSPLQGRMERGAKAGSLAAAATLLLLVAAHLASLWLGAAGPSLGRAAERAALLVLWALHAVPLLHAVPRCASSFMRHGASAAAMAASKAGRSLAAAGPAVVAAAGWLRSILVAGIAAAQSRLKHCTHLAASGAAAVMAGAGTHARACASAAAAWAGTTGSAVAAAAGVARSAGGRALGLAGRVAPSPRTLVLLAAGVACTLLVGAACVAVLVWSGPPAGAGGSQM